MIDRKAALIVYVDDDSGNRLVFEHTFGEAFWVQTASSGAEALKILGSQKVAVLITDQRMPELSGNELLEIARQRHPEIVRMVITAYSDLDPILRSVNDGLVARYVIKPWDRTQIEEMLAWGLETYELGSLHAETQLRLLAMERLATLGSINAAMIHDLSQPLSYIQYNVDHLAELAKSSAALARLVRYGGDSLQPEDRHRITELAAELPEIVETLTHGAQMITTLVRGVEYLLRPRPAFEGQVGSDPTVGVSFALAVCRRSILAVNGEPVFDEVLQLPRCALGNAELAQVLINLLTNAAQALGRQRTGAGRVECRWRDVGDFLEFVVSDNGPGMSAETQQKVGTPFFTTRTDGTGIGVSQCKRLVEGAGGKIQIESREGVGTTVTFTVRKTG
ncbi:MAG: response regulator [Deltaproteobacteria bacterium]|nr:response regulator [Deltaproteobacteria bacterium]